MSEQFLRFPIFLRQAVPHGMTRKDRSLAHDGDISWRATNTATLTNRKIWWSRLGLPLEATVFGQQVHGAHVAHVTRSECGRGAMQRETSLTATDALITTDPTVVLAVICADCVPILLYAPDVPAVAAIHAGWRGTVAHITLRTVEQLIQTFQARPERILAVLGPSIGPCCYHVGPEVIDLWLSDAPPGGEQAVDKQDGHFIFNLWEANQLQLLAAGLDPKHIETSGICTRCRHEEWFSYRAQGPHAGAQAAVIALPGSTERRRDYHD